MLFVIRLLCILLSYSGYCNATNSCSKLCKCGEDLDTGLIIVTCRQGSYDNKKFARLLYTLPQNTGSLSVRSPEHKPSKLSLTPDLKHFKQLHTLSLNNAGIESLGKRVFRNMANIRTLNVANNNIDYLTIDAFQGLTDLVHLDLSDNKLGRNMLPTGTFSQLTNLEYLSLAGNYITHFSGSLLSGLKNLKTLNLDNNYLNSSELRALIVQLPNLETLSIGGCGLRTLDEATFRGMHRLHTLSISDNALGHVPQIPLRAMPNLRHLDMSKNNLTMIPGHTFLNMSLTSLILSHNLLGNCHSEHEVAIQNGLEPSSFQGLNLVQLDLSYNNYQVFNSNYLGAVKSTIRILHLSGNPLKTIDSFHVSGTKLTELHVSDIGMQSMPGKLPSDLALIRKLNISHNPLRKLTYQSTEQLLNLRDMEELDLSFCKLTELSSHVQKLAHRLDTIHMHNNPFDCGCKILPVRDFLLLPRNRHRCQMLKLDQVLCASPPSQIGLPVVKVQNPVDCAVIFGASSGLTQQSEMGILVALLLTATLILGACIALVFYSRTCRKKGSYRTREDSRRHLSGCSSEQDSIPAIDRPPLIAHDSIKERLF